MQSSPHFHVRVPGSTSNLGPGFDFLGLAVGLYLDATVTVALGSRASGHRVTYGTPGSNQAATVPWAASDDLVLRTLQAYERHVNRTLPPLDAHMVSEIPVGRGFGSSGAAVASTLLLASAIDKAHHGDGASTLHRRHDDVQPQAQSGEIPPSRDGLIALALELEGHPDNGTASLLGGCTAAVPTPEDAHGPMAVIQPPVHDTLGLALAWPEAPLFTPDARAALPDTVPLSEAVENPRRLALLLQGLRTGDPRLLRLGVADQLHERYRRALIPGADAAIAAAHAAGAYAACLSGAGSGLVAIGPPATMESIAAAMAAPLLGGVGRAVDVVRNAPVVRQGPASEKSS